MTTATLLDHPIYDVPSAARLLGLDNRRVRRWLCGYANRDYRHEDKPLVTYPPVIGRDNDGEHASFLDLIELLFAKAFLNHGFTLPKMRNALTEARRLTQELHPFATRRFFLMDTGAFIEMDGNDGDTVFYDLFKQDQTAIKPVVQALAKTIDFHDRSGLAEAWYPLGKDGRIAIDPRFSAGEPTVAQSGLKTSVLYHMFLAENENADRVAEMYQLKSDDVMAAVRFETGARQAA